MRIRVLILLAAFMLTGFAGSAIAHGLNIFAWLENDSILVQCDFGQNRPAPNASVVVYDSVDRQELARGVTDNQGRFVFPVPGVIRHGHGLLIVANAGQGHQGEWTMDASELYAAASLTAGFDQAAIETGVQTPGHARMTPAGVPMPQGAVTQEQIRNIVQEALELKLSPIRQEIAARSASGPSLVEIIGGIGWIMGLVGIALYFKSRKSA